MAVRELENTQFQVLEWLKPLECLEKFSPLGKFAAAPEKMVSMCAVTCFMCDSQVHERP